MWEEREIIVLPTRPGDRASAANAINNNGQIVGWSASSLGHQKAVIWQGVLVIELDELPSRL